MKFEISENWMKEAALSELDFNSIGAGPIRRACEGDEVKLLNGPDEGSIGKVIRIIGKGGFVSVQLSSRTVKVAQRDIERVVATPAPPAQYAR